MSKRASPGLLAVRFPSRIGGILTSCALPQDSLNFKDWILCPRKSGPSCDMSPTLPELQTCPPLVLVLGLLEPVCTTLQRASSLESISPEEEAGAGGIGQSWGHHIQSLRLFIAPEGRWGLKSSPHSACQAVPSGMAASARGEGTFPNLHIGTERASSDPGWRAQRIASSQVFLR